MCSGFAGLTQYSRRGVVVFKRLQNIIDGAPSLPTFDLESNIDIVSRCTINDGISTLTVNTNGVDDDGGAAAPLRLNDARDINVLFFFHPIKDVVEGWRRGDRRRRQRWDNVAVGYISEWKRADGG